MKIILQGKEYDSFHDVWGILELKVWQNVFSYNSLSVYATKEGSIIWNRQIDGVQINEYALNYATYPMWAELGDQVKKYSPMTHTYISTSSKMAGLMHLGTSI
jgi:hypothetical protein